METTNWIDRFPDDADDAPAAASCLARQECVEELIRDAGPGCLYCRLAALADEEDDE